MITRCKTKKGRNFQNYGARGIKVCKRWRHSFPNFLSDMGPKSTGLSLDRKNNNLGYTPSNCRWATPKQQMNNTKWNRVLKFKGFALSVSQWAEKIGVKAATLNGRLKEGWTTRRTLTEAAARNRYHRKIIKI